jgi:hypothetical protein
VLRLQTPLQFQFERFLAYLGEWLQARVSLKKQSQWRKNRFGMWILTWRASSCRAIANEIL